MGRKKNLLKLDPKQMAMEALDARQYTSLEEFISASQNKPWVQWFREYYKKDPNEIVQSKLNELFRIIYSEGHDHPLSKILRGITEMTQKQFAAYFEIPVRTLEDWDAGKSSPPVYVLSLLQRVILYEFADRKIDASMYSVDKREIPLYDEHIDNHI